MCGLWEREKAPQSLIGTSELVDSVYEVSVEFGARLALEVVGVVCDVFCQGCLRGEWLSLHDLP